MTKVEAYSFLAKHSSDVQFVANIILTKHKDSAKKLKHLVRMVQDGKDIRMADFSCDQLMVNGEKMSWEELNEDH